MFFIIGHGTIAPSADLNSYNVAMVEAPGNGLISIPGHQTVDGTVEKLQSMLAAKGVKVFAVIDHSGEAAAAGLSMPNTKLVIFGNPKGGTPVMLASPSAALDLPLKILVSEDRAGKVWVSYNSVEFLRGRHGFPQELAANLAVIDALAAKAAE